MRGQLHGDAGEWRRPDASSAGPLVTAMPPVSDTTAESASPDLSAPAGAAQRPGLSGKSGKQSLIGSYVALTKPRIVELLLVTTVPAMFLAADGVPPLWTALATLVGGTLAAGGANVLNCYIDRDIDRLMPRTANRPLPQDVIPARNALIFGVTLGALALVLLLATTNPLATALAIGANLYYVVVYTLLLKRRTSQNTFWGCFCGAAPVLIGWAAITGSVSWAAWAMFGVVFFWQLPHFYALAMRYRADYSAAGVPMLPVVAKPMRVMTEIMIYSVAMGLCSIALWPLGGMSPFYGAVAIATAVWAMVEPIRLLRRVRSGADPQPMKLFKFSITYLSILSLAITVDALVF